MEGDGDVVVAFDDVMSGALLREIGVVYVCALLLLVLLVLLVKRMLMVKLMRWRLLPLLLLRGLLSHVP